MNDWTRPVDPEVRRVLAERWAALPDGVRSPAQTLGRHAVGCEGTHGVFPKCDLACTPCYHSRDANQVRVDGAHTVAEVDAQMAYARSRRGPRAHAQLIGGEVTLLPPDDHAAALQVMHAHGREPMSMTHGDFDYGYLERLALGADGAPLPIPSQRAAGLSVTNRGVGCRLSLGSPVRTTRDPVDGRMLSAVGSRSGGST